MCVFARCLLFYSLHIFVYHFVDLSLAYWCNFCLVSFSSSYFFLYCYLLYYIFFYLYVRLFIFLLCFSSPAKRGSFRNVSKYIRIYKPSADYLTVLFNELRLRFHWIRFLWLLLRTAIEDGRKKNIEITRQMRSSWIEKPTNSTVEKKHTHTLNTSSICVTLNSWSDGKYFPNKLLIYS